MNLERMEELEREFSEWMSGKEASLETARSFLDLCVSKARTTQEAAYLQILLTLATTPINTLLMDIWENTKGKIKEQV